MCCITNYKMDLTGVLWILSFFIVLRVIGFRFFEPNVCYGCNKNKSTIRKELWESLKTESGIKEIKKKNVDIDLDEISEEELYERSEELDESSEELDESSKKERSNIIYNHIKQVYE
jgi:hypothetical protein